MLTACHAISSLPFLERNPQFRSKEEKFQGLRPLKSILLYQLLSALLWKKLNGPIKLYCDPIYLELLKSYQLTDVYDSINTELLKQELPIDKKNFYAYSRILALQDMQLPAVILDSDLLVACPVEAYVADYDLVCTWAEAASPANHYGQLDRLPVAPGYRFPPGINPDSMALAVGFLYLNHENLRREYVSESLRFMGENSPCGEPLPGQSRTIPTMMLFAEQHLLGILAEKMGASRGLLREARGGDDLGHGIEALYKHSQENLSHLGKYKEVLQNSDRLGFKKRALERELCDCLSGLFPDYAYIVENIMGTNT